MNFRSILSILIIGLSISSCSNTRGFDAETVSGTVTFDGVPLDQGDITFRPAAGLKSGGGGLVKDGKFSFQAPQAAMRVEISSYREIPGKFTEPNPGEKVPVTEQIIPAKYNSKSELTAEVTGGKNQFTFELTSK